tara:strand:+ start:667 stop:1206 length:540 start_codon:yes stop_codon:yes gene_type:complete
MADIVDTDKPDKTPLLKEKKTRPPQSEKQMANFRIMQETRAKKVECTKQEKILTAQRALLVKEGYVKKPIVAVQPLQFEIDEKEEEEEEEEPLPLPIKTKRILKEKALPPPQKVKPLPRKLKPREQEPESDSESSDEEITIIRRKKSSKAKAKGKRIMDAEECDDVAEMDTSDYMKFFC